MLSYHPTTNQLSNTPFYCSCHKVPYKDPEEPDLIMRLKKIKQLNSIYFQFLQGRITVWIHLYICPPVDGFFFFLLESPVQQ